MKRKLMEVDTNDQPPRKKIRLEHKIDLKELVYQLGEERKLQEAVNYIDYEKEEDRLPLIHSLLAGLAKSSCPTLSINYIKTFLDDNVRDELGEYFIAQLAINQKFNHAINWVEMYPVNERFFYCVAYLAELAKTGLLYEGLKFIQKQDAHHRMDLREFFITSLVACNHLEETLRYVETTPAREPKRYSLRRAVLTGFAKRSEIDAAEAFLATPLMSHYSRFSLRKEFIDDLVEAGHLDTAEQYLDLVLQRTNDEVFRAGLRNALVKRLTKETHLRRAINQIIKAPEQQQTKLLLNFVNNINYDFDDENPYVKVMVFINNKKLNTLFADNICTWEAGLYGNTLLSEANKIIAIKSRYQIENFMQASAIAKLGEGERMWILKQHGMFAQKKLPEEVFDKITENLLDLSSKNAKAVRHAVQSYHEDINERQMNLAYGR